VRENDRLRRKNRILKEEREVLKKAVIFLRAKNYEVRSH
jgi:transposase-like protein